MSFPAYPGYKHSGVELLGELPEHWTLKRFKNVFEERAERSADGLEELLSVSAYFGIKPRSESRDEGDHLSRAESLEGYKVCHPGDLVINIMLAWNRGLGFSWQSGIVSPAYCVFHVTDGSSPKFLDYLVRSDECIRYFKTHSAGIMDSRLRLYPESFGRLFTAIPPTCEQTQIARFLDHETARIDALIEEQQRLIELLKEKRQAVISHSVTKGLDPTVPMKDSGVEWLGEVPAHWGVKALRYLGECQNGINIGGEAFGAGSPFVSYGDVYKNDVLPAEVTGLVQSSPEDQQRYSIEYGDVFFTRTSETVDEIGFSATCLQDLPSAVFAGFLIRFRPTGKSLTPGFSKYYFRNQGLRIFFNKEMNLVTRASLSQDLLKLLPVTIPPVVEQIKISDFLDKVTAEFASLLQQGIKAIDLLKERRSALISAAVTGKIDVRSWQLPTSSQAPELAVAEAV